MDICLRSVDTCGILSTMTAKKSSARSNPAAKKAPSKKSAKKKAPAKKVPKKKVAKRKATSKRVDKETGLTMKAMDFLYGVFRGLSVADAYTNAGYKHDPKLAHAYVLLSKDVSKRFLSNLEDQRKEVANKGAIADKNELLEYATRVLRVKVTDIEKEENADLVSERREVLNETGGSIFYKFVGKIDSFRELAKLQGFYPKEEINLNVLSDNDSDGWLDAIRDSPEIQDELKSMLDQVKS